MSIKEALTPSDIVVTFIKKKLKEKEKKKTLDICECTIYVTFRFHFTGYNSHLRRNLQIDETGGRNMSAEKKVATICEIIMR